MSLIVAIKDKDRVVLGADRQVSTGGNKDHICTKIWQVSELPGAIMGGVGSARVSQIIQYSTIVDKNYMPAEIDTQFISTSLAPVIAAVLKEAGVGMSVEEKETMVPMIPNAFIFAYKDKAWVIWNDLSILEVSDYYAIGSGSDVARGALFATTDKDPFHRIVTSIEAAADSTLYVDNGIDLLATKFKSRDGKLIAKALNIDLNTLESLEV